MRAKAKEARGQGTASANIRMALREQDAGTEASIVTEMQMSGKAAAMGQGVIKDVAGALTDTFARNLAKLVDAPAAEPASAPTTPMEEPPSLDAGRIAASVASQRARDPRTVAFVVLLVLLIGIAIGRRRR
jgi:hypothetical protein